MTVVLVVAVIVAAAVSAANVIEFRLNNLWLTFGPWTSAMLPVAGVVIAVAAAGALVIALRHPARAVGPVTLLIAVTMVAGFL